MPQASLILRAREIIIDNNLQYEDLPPAKIKKEHDFLNDVKYKDDMFIQRTISLLPKEFKDRYVKNNEEAKSIEKALQELTNKLYRLLYKRKRKKYS